MPGQTSTFTDSPGEKPAEIIDQTLQLSVSERDVVLYLIDMTCYCTRL